MAVRTEDRLRMEKQGVALGGGGSREGREVTKEVLGKKKKKVPEARGCWLAKAVELGEETRERSKDVNERREGPGGQQVSRPRRRGGGTERKKHTEDGEHQTALLSSCYLPTSFCRTMHYSG